MKNLILLCLVGVSAWSQTSTTVTSGVVSGAVVPTAPPTTEVIWQPGGGTVNANTCVSISFSFIGARSSDVASVGLPPTAQSGLIVNAFVSGIEMVEIFACNITSSNITGLSSDYYKVIFQ